MSQRWHGTVQYHFPLIPNKMLKSQTILSLYAYSTWWLRIIAWSEWMFYTSKAFLMVSYNAFISVLVLHMTNGEKALKIINEHTPVPPSSVFTGDGWCLKASNFPKLVERWEKISAISILQMEMLKLCNADIKMWILYVNSGKPL